MISVICPVFNEKEHIAQCIESMIAQDYPKQDMELLLIDGGSGDGTLETIASYQKQYNFIHLIDNSKQKIPYALNIGIKAALGDIIIRIDAHSIYPTNYVSKLKQKLIEYQAGNVGARWNISPSNNSAVAVAIAETLKSPWGVGNARYKIGITLDKDIETDTVPFGCFYKSLFDEIGFYDETLHCNEDDELNARIKKKDKKIWLIHDLFINYYARETFKKLFRMNFRYGLFKPKVNKKNDGITTWRQLIPPLFVVGIVVGGILSILFRPIRPLYISILALYLLIGIGIGFRQAAKHRNLKLIYLMPFSFLVNHCGYGIGYIVGLFQRNPKDINTR